MLHRRCSHLDAWERSSLRSSKSIVYESGLKASCEHVSIAIYFSSHSRQRRIDSRPGAAKCGSPALMLSLHLCRWTAPVADYMRSDRAL